MLHHLRWNSCHPSLHQSYRTMNVIRQNVYGDPSEVKANGYISLIISWIQAAATACDTYTLKKMSQIKVVQHDAAGQTYMFITVVQDCS